MIALTSGQFRHDIGEGVKMRKFFGLVLLVFLFLVSSTQAGFNPQLLEFGGKAGVSICDVVGHSQSTETRTGYTLGGFVNYQVSRVFFLQAELLLNVKGYRVPNSEVELRDSLNRVTDTAILTISPIISYLELPILVKCQAPLPGKYFPYLIGGGYAWLAARDRVRLTGSYDILDFKLGNVRKVGYGAIIGAGIDVKAGRGKAFFETRYDIGLSSVLYVDDFKMRTISFQAGYRF